MKTIFAFLTVALAACTSSPLDPGAGSNPGSGTSTLVVNGSAIAQPRVANSSQASDFTTDLSVRITLNNTPVTTGTVTMKSRTVSVPLTFNANGGGQGSWSGTAAGYDEVYQLDIVAGADTVNGVIVDGPDIHTITAPTAGASLDSTIANTLTWSRGGMADTATFSVIDNTNGLVVPDSGTYSIAPLSLKSDKAQTRTNTLRLTRANRVTPTGAASGSMITVGIENDLDVVVLANPNGP